MLAAGSGAYLSAEGVRPFDIGTAGDPDALFGIEAFSPSGSDGDRVDLMQVRNGFDETMHTIDVEVLQTGQGNLDVLDIQTPDPLAEGATGVVSGELACDGLATDVDVDVEITASGTNDGFEGTRTLQVSCEAIDLDPRDCRDILQMSCDYSETGDYEFSHATLDGSLCVDGLSGTIDVTLGVNSRVEGFVRVENMDGLAFELGERGVVEEAVNLHQASGDASIDLRQQSQVLGDFCASADGDLSADCRLAAFGRSLTLDAGVDADVVLRETIELGSSMSVLAGRDVDVVHENQSETNGPVHVNSGREADVLIRNTAEVHGDVDVHADTDATVDVRNNARIDGDLVVSAGGDAEVTIARNAEITGEVSVDADGEAHVTGA